MSNIGGSETAPAEIPRDGHMWRRYKCDCGYEYEWRWQQVPTPVTTKTLLTRIATLEKALALCYRTDLPEIEELEESDG